MAGQRFPLWGEILSPNSPTATAALGELVREVVKNKRVWNRFCCAANTTRMHRDLGIGVGLVLLVGFLVHDQRRRYCYRCRLKAGSGGGLLEFMPPAVMTDFVSTKSMINRYLSSKGDNNGKRPSKFPACKIVSVASCQQTLAQVQRGVGL